ncbi:MAG: hypothetical protein ACK559_24160, partial [bacterium]
GLHRVLGDPREERLAAGLVGVDVAREASRVLDVLLVAGDGLVEALLVERVVDHLEVVEGARDGAGDVHPGGVGGIAGRPPGGRRRRRRGVHGSPQGTAPAGLRAPGRPRRARGLGLAPD